jgi:hypothetical protein
LVLEQKWSWRRCRVPKSKRGGERRDIFGIKAGREQKKVPKTGAGRRAEKA